MKGVKKIKILLRKIQCPDTSPRTQVKHTLRVVDNWSKVQLSSKRETVNVVPQVHSFLFFIIIRL